MANETKASEDVSNLNSFDCIRSLALAVMFVVMTFSNRRTWFLADTIGSVLMGAFHLIYPQIYLKQHIAEANVDDLQCVITQIFAAFLFASGIYRILVRKSRDDNVVSTLVWSRVLVLLLWFIFGFYLRTTSKFYIRKEHFSFVLFGTGAWLISSVVQLVRYNNPLGGVDKSGTIVLILRLEFLCSFVFGLVHLAFPGWLLGFQVKRANLFHRFLLRIVGMMLLGTSFEAQQAVNFRFDADRTSFFLSRVLTYAISAVALARCYVYDDILNRKELFSASLMFLSALPSLAGLLLSLTGYGATKKSDRYSSSSSSYYTRSKTSY